MNDWFTMDRVDADTYIISEYRHWEETHSYLGGLELSVPDLNLSVQLSVIYPYTEISTGWKVFCNANMIK